LRLIAVVALLGTACLAWSAIPLTGTGAPGVLALLVAATCVYAGVLRLMRKGTGGGEPAFVPSTWARLLDQANFVLVRTGWESGAAVAMVVLEALHRSRPWHTGLLAVAVLGYLLAVHRAESAFPLGTLRRQSRALVVSVALVAVTTGVAMVPSPGTGTLSGWLEIVAALAAVTAGGLALPL
jgi:hypothetical protein